MKSIHPAVFAPGLVVWPLIIIGAVQENWTLIGVGIALAISSLVAGLIIKGLRFTAARAAEARIWHEGAPGIAKVLSISSRGGGMNGHPRVEFELEIQPEAGSAYPARASVIIDKLAIPRVQPGCELQVRVDPSDPSRVALDESVTYLKYER